MTSPDAVLLANELRHAIRPIFRRQLAEGGLSLGKRGVLQHLFRSEPCTPAELAAAEQVKPQSMTTMLHELEELGLVARANDPDDGRRVWLRLSTAGHAWVVHQRTSRDGWLVSAVADLLSDDDRNVLEAALPVLRRLTGQSPLDTGAIDARMPIDVDADQNAGAAALRTTPVRA